MKTFLQAGRFFALGALIGSVVASLAAPALARTLHVRVASMCDCEELTNLIIETFWTVQGTGFVLGAILGLAFWTLLRRKGKLKTPL